MGTRKEELDEANKVINMSRMFKNMNKLKKINLSKFASEKILDMSHLFENCNIQY